MKAAGSLWTTLLSMCLARRHVAIMLPPSSDASSENKSAAGRVSLSSHNDLREPTDDDSASVDAVVSAHSKNLVM